MRGERPVVAVTLKLKLRPAQERMLSRWLWHLTGVYNWATRKLEADARSGVYWSQFDLEALLRGHGKKIGIPAHVVQATARTAFIARKRFISGLSSRPRLKSRRNTLSHISFPDPVQIRGRKVSILGVGSVAFHDRLVPAGQTKSAKLILRASGWHLLVFVESAPATIPHRASGEVGIDPGFSSLVALSSGELIAHPRELQRTAIRLAQSQRGNRKYLAAGLFERQGNQRRDRNHKLSRRLVSENALVAWSKDGHAAIARRFGKSVASAAHGQLRQMLAYKCRAGGREFIEVPGRYSTVTCSACGARSGPAGYAGLSVRQWTCGCGAEHERDVNAARNTLIAARGLRVERTGNRASGIATRSNTAMVTGAHVDG